MLLSISNPVSYFLLNGRSKRYTVQEAKQLHSYFIKLKSDSSMYLVNSIIHTYAANGDLNTAYRLFDRVIDRDVVSWTTLIDGYAKIGNMGVAQQLFDSMPERNLVSWNVLISGFGKCGDVKAAKKAFDQMIERDIVSWNSLISSYTRNGFAKEAFEVFCDALVENLVTPNKVMFLSVLPAIAESGCAFWGRCVHSFILRSGIEVDSVLCSALVGMYSKCDDLDMAFQVFESNPFRGNVASWNPMLSGLVRNQRFEEALELFRWMQFENVEPDYVTMVAILPAIADKEM